jgi:HSP20 family protein
MAESISRYFLSIPGGQKQRPSGRLWCPAADIYQVADGWFVKLDLAGISADDLEIEISGNTLRIAGCRRDTFLNENISCHQLEITYSRFEKTLQFPCSIEGSHIDRTYQDGLLILHVQCEIK